MTEYEAGEAGRMFDMIDTNHGGTVSLDEFAAWWWSLTTCQTATPATAVAAWSPSLRSHQAPRVVAGAVCHSAVRGALPLLLFCSLEDRERWLPQCASTAGLVCGKRALLHH